MFLCSIFKQRKEDAEKRQKRFIGLILAVILVCLFVFILADEHPVPELDEMYPGQTVRPLRKTNEQRVFAYYGPGAIIPLMDINHISKGRLQPISIKADGD